MSAFVHSAHGSDGSKLIGVNRWCMIRTSTALCHVRFPCERKAIAPPQTSRHVSLSCLISEHDREITIAGTAPLRQQPPAQHRMSTCTRTLRRLVLEEDVDGGGWATAHV